MYLLTYREPYENAEILGLFAKESDAVKEIHLQIDLHTYQGEKGVFMAYKPDCFYIRKMQVR